MKIYTDGCSGTYGDDLPEDIRETVNWPALVAQHYNAELFNNACRNSSNQRVCTQLLQNIGKFDRYYLSWTKTSRFTLYDPANWYEINFNTELIHSMYHSKDHFRTFGKYYYAYWRNELFDFKQWLGQIVLTQKLLESHNAHYVMVAGASNNFKYWTAPREQFIDSIKDLINISNFNDDQIYQQHKEIQYLIQQIDFTTFIDPIDYNLESIVSPYPQSTGDHPLLEGHRAIADTIINFDKAKEQL